MRIKNKLHDLEDSWSVRQGANCLISLICSRFPRGKSKRERKITMTTRRPKRGLSAEQQEKARKRARCSRNNKKQALYDKTLELDRINGRIRTTTRCLFTTNIKPQIVLVSKHKEVVFLQHKIKQNESIIETSSILVSNIQALVRVGGSLPQ